MISRRHFLLGAVSTGALVGGCTQLESPGNREVGFEVGAVVTRSDDQYRFESRLSAVAHRTDGRTYEDITVEFYGRDEQLLDRVTVPAITTDEEGEMVHATLTAEPVAVVLDSPTFWDDPNLIVYGLVRSDSEWYDRYEVSETRELPDNRE